MLREADLGTGMAVRRFGDPWYPGSPASRGASWSLGGPSSVCESPPRIETTEGPTRPRFTARLGVRARAAMLLRNMSPRTEDGFMGWRLRDDAFHGRQDPSRLGAEHVTSLPNALATRPRVSASTQNRAPAALLFPFREVRGLPLPWLEGLVRATILERLRVVLSREPVA